MACGGSYDVSDLTLINNFQQKVRKNWIKFLAERAIVMMFCNQGQV